MTMGNFDAMLKELYPAGVPEHVATRKYPLLNMMTKKDDFEGDNLVVPVQFDYPAGRSAVFSTAQSVADRSRMIKFNLTQMEDHQVVFVDALTIRASRSNRGAFIEARKNEIDGGLLNLGRSAALSLYRDGWGAIGVLNTDSPSGSSFTLATPYDAHNFALGMTIMFADEADGGTPRDSSDTLVVSGINPDTGVITTTTAVTGISGLVAGDYVFPVGDNDAAGTTKRRMTGLAGWLPLTAPTSGDSFFGVDRSVMPTRLAGQRLDATGNTIEENILQLAEKCVQEGGMPDYCAINHANFTNLVKGLGTKVEYQGAGGTANVGFQYVTIHTSAGPTKVFADPACPSNRGYLLQMDTWCIHHLDGFPHIDRIDGNSGLRMSTADGIEIRMRAWSNVACRAPGWNGVFSI